jgi:hypothetical protein
MKSRMVVTAFAISAVTVLQSQTPVDLATIARIKQEALTRSQVMDHVGWMSDVYGPRVTGTPNYQRAADWAVKRMQEWGLANVHQERFAFGQGWRVERFSAHIVSPEPQPIIGYPRTYSPSTSGARIRLRRAALSPVTSSASTFAARRISTSTRGNSKARSSCRKPRAACA